MYWQRKNSDFIYLELNIGLTELGRLVFNWTLGMETTDFTLGEEVSVLSLWN